MGSTTGIKMNWPLVAIAFAVIGVPMGVALIEDLGKDGDDEAALARIGEMADISAVEESATEPELENADDIAGRWHEPAMEQSFFDEVFLGGPDDAKPALRGPLAGFDFTAPREPDLSRWPKAGVELGTANIVIAFPDDGTAQRVFESRWGKPLLMAGTDDLSRRIWTDADAQLRLVLEQHDGQARAMFSPCIPAAGYIGYNGRFAFETSPVLGATADQLAQKYGLRFSLLHGGESGSLECPGVEVSERGASCDIVFERGKAVRLTVTIDHMFDPDGGPHLFNALKSRLGEVRQQSGDEHGNTWTFDHGYTVTQVAGTAAITVERVAK
jgi:hypothetical protein